MSHNHTATISTGQTFQMTLTDHRPVWFVVTAPDPATFYAELDRALSDLAEVDMLDPRWGRVNDLHDLITASEYGGLWEVSAWHATGRAATASAARLAGLGYVTQVVKSRITYGGNDPR